MTGLICLLVASQAGETSLWSYIRTWLLLTLGSSLFLLACSSLCFYFLYYRPSFNIWRFKINPEFPSAAKVKEEITVMCQGIIFSTICPALSIYLTQNKLGKGYCGVDESNGGYMWLFISFFVVWLITDFYEFMYHYLGHKLKFMWTLHRDHHHFFNPTPFAVVADSPVDQLFRAAPLFLLPLALPINLDMIFTMFSVLFYMNGLIQHSGYEIKWLENLGVDGHSRMFLTSYHHYLHHSKAVMNKPLYNGQLLQVWDHIFGSSGDTALDLRSDSASGRTCSCSKCARSLGLRLVMLFVIDVFVISYTCKFVRINNIIYMYALILFILCKL
jgi:lathosterol oxidase